MVSSTTRKYWTVKKRDKLLSERFVLQNGYSEYQTFVYNNRIDGGQFLKLSEIDLHKNNLLTTKQVRRLWEFLEKVRRNIKLFYLPQDNFKEKDLQGRSVEQAQTKPFEKLLEQNAYYHNVDRVEGERLLRNSPHGSFLLRPSTKYCCVLMVIVDRQVCNIPIAWEHPYFFLFKDDCSPKDDDWKFYNLDQLILYYAKTPIFIKDSYVTLLKDNYFKKS